MPAGSCLTPVGLITFPNIFEPRAASPGAEPRYSLILIFDDVAMKTAAFAAMNQLKFEAAVAKWGEAKMRDKNFVLRLKNPLRDCAEKADKYAGFVAGNKFIQPWSKFQPDVVDYQGQPITDPKLLFAGQLGRVNVSAFAYETSGNMGVSFSLGPVQIVKADMPRLDGRKSAAETFAGATDDLSAYNPTSPLLSGGSGGSAARGSKPVFDPDECPF